MSRLGGAVRRSLLALALGAAVSGPASAEDSAAVARGGYLAAAAGCDACHTDSENGGARYAGGRVLQTAFGPMAAPNITPDRTTGIGGWTAQDFVRAMRWGIAPDGTHYVPAFPFPYFARLTDGDLADLKAFLDSLPPVKRAIAGAPTLRLAARARAAIGVAIGADVSPPPVAKDNPAVARGAYLVETVGRCGDCHTPLTWLGAPDMTRYLAGARGGLWGGGANITPDPKTGIGAWSVVDIAEALRTGEAPDFDVLGKSMAEIVRNTARLTDADRRAIAAYLKAIPPKTLGKNN